MNSIKKIKTTNNLEFFTVSVDSKKEIPFIDTMVSAGFPSPADDYLEDKLDLNEYLIKHPAATFFVRVAGDSMINAGIYDNDIIIVDRSIKPKHGKIVVAALDGQMTIKRLYRRDDKIMLLPENELFKPIEILDSMDMVIWGVATNVIHSL